jgi:hypothetical protein
MKKIVLAVLALLMCSNLSFAGGLDNFIGSLNVQARTDMNDFSVRLSTQFGIPQTQVSAVISSVREPADAFIVLQLGQWAQLPPERVLRTYESQRGKGWGAMAKSLGIKPGSAEFHALKQGNLTFSGKPYHDQGKNKGKNKNKDKGKDKGNNK